MEVPPPPPMQNAIEPYMQHARTSFDDSAPSSPSDPWHVMSCKVSDWRSGNDTSVRRMLRDMVNRDTIKVVICVEETDK